MGSGCNPGAGTFPENTPQMEEKGCIDAILEISKTTHPI